MTFRPQKSWPKPLPLVQSLKDPTRLKFSCKSCKAKGRVAAYTPMRERQQPPRIKCAGCQELLSEERLKAMPGTHLCVECSSSGPNDDTLADQLKLTEAEREELLPVSRFA